MGGAKLYQSQTGSREILRSDTLGTGASASLSVKRSMCVQLFNNIYPFPLFQVVPLSQTALATDLCWNTKRSDQPDHSAQATRANQTLARWAVCYRSRLQ